jgi:hypothetical protein
MQNRITAATTPGQHQGAFGAGERTSTQAHSLSGGGLVCFYFMFDDVGIALKMRVLERSGGGIAGLLDCWIVGLLDCRRLLWRDRFRWRLAILAPLIFQAAWFQQRPGFERRDAARVSRNQSDRRKRTQNRLFSRRECKFRLVAATI